VADRLLASTRKGLFFFDRTGSGWKRSHVAFLGENVTLSQVGPRDGSIYASLNLGHFGAKLKCSDDGGQSW
jgi:hypothetical protein